MQLEAETTYNRELITEAALVYWRKTFAGTFFIALAGAVLAVVLLSLDSRTWITGTFLAVSIIACVVFVFAFFIYRARSLAVFRQMESPTARWRFSEQGISVESDAGKSEINWNLIKMVLRSSRAWLLVYKSSAYSVFPIAGVSGDVLGFICKKTVENGGKVY